jgi:hypothetical protein
MLFIVEGSGGYVMRKYVSLVYCSSIPFILVILACVL